MHEDDAVPVVPEDAAPPSRRLAEKAQDPEQHLRHGHDVGAVVENHVRLLELELVEHFVHGDPMLSRVDEPIGKSALVHAHHDGRHLDELSLRSQDDVDHAFVPGLGISKRCG